MGIRNRERKWSREKFTVVVVKTVAEIGGEGVGGGGRRWEVSAHCYVSACYIITKEMTALFKNKIPPPHPHFP